MSSKHLKTLAALLLLSVCLTFLYLQYLAPTPSSLPPSKPLSVDDLCARHRSAHYERALERRYLYALEHPETARIANPHIKQVNTLDEELRNTSDDHDLEDDLASVEFTTDRAPTLAAGRSVSEWSLEYHHEIQRFCDFEETSPSARESIIKALSMSQHSCETSTVCETVNYCHHFTSRFNLAGCHILRSNKERRALEARLLKTQPRRCQSPPESYLKPWVYDYRVLSDDQVFIYNDRRQISLEISGLGKRIRAIENKPKTLAYLDAHKHKVLFPVHEPIIEYHGSGRYAYLHKNISAVDGALGSDYIFPVTTPEGDFVVFWRIDGTSLGDSLIVYNLRDGLATALGPNPSAEHHLPNVPTDQQRYTHEVPMELGGNNSDVRVWESRSPHGFRIKQYDKQNRAFQVYDPVDRRLTSCASFSMLKE